MNQLKILEIASQLEHTVEDDDVRQEIILAMLETGNHDAQDHLDKILEIKNFQDTLQCKLKQIISEDQHVDVLELISDFSSNQQSIIILIMLGYPLDFIARYKNMCNLRFAQTLKFISKHEVWGTYFEKKKIKHQSIIRLNC